MLRKLSFLSALVLAACGSNVYDIPAPAYSADLDPTSGELHFEFPSGYQTTSVEEFQTDLEAFYQGDTSALANVNLGENISRDLGGNDGSEHYPRMPFKKIPIGRWVLTGGGSAGGYVPGCIGRVTPHFNIRLNTLDGRQVFDWHFAWRFENGWKCLDMYESVRPTNWCNNPCMPTGSKVREFFENVRSGISQAALDQGVPYATATALGTVGAYLVIAGVALIPGPPLPP